MDNWKFPPPYGKTPVPGECPNCRYIGGLVKNKTPFRHVIYCRECDYVKDIDGFEIEGDDHGN